MTANIEYPHVLKRIHLVARVGFPPQRERPSWPRSFPHGTHGRGGRWRRCHHCHRCRAGPEGARFRQIETHDGQTPPDPREGEGAASHAKHSRLREEARRLKASRSPARRAERSASGSLLEPLYTNGASKARPMTSQGSDVIRKTRVKAMVIAAMLIRYTG